MRHQLHRLALPLLILLWAGSALAAGNAAPPPPDQDAAAWLQALYAAFSSHAWGTLAGLVLIALVWPLRRFGPEVLKSKLGGVVLAFAISLAATLGAALAAGAAISWTLVAGALTTSAAASGIWEWLKDLFPGVAASAAKSSSSPAPTGTVGA